MADRITQPTGAQPTPVQPPPAPLRQLGPDSRIDELRDRLRVLKQPIYGTKAECHARLVAAEAKAELQRREREWLETRQAELRAGVEPLEVQSQKIPEKPSEAEQEKHFLTHLPLAPWCLTCLLARSTARPHASIPVTVPTVPQIQMDFNYYTKDGELMDVESGKVPDGAWTTTLTAVDRPTQNLIHITVPEKSVEADGYMAKTSAEFVKRMAYKSAEILTDGEPSVVALAAEVIRICKSFDIVLQQKVAPRYCSATLGSVGKAQDLAARQVRATRRDLEGRCGVELTPSMLAVAGT